jgi:TATA-box binding protein (TBP) (component of TFIID and TFIIIB)
VKEVMDDPHRVVAWEDPMRTVLLIVVSGRIVLTGAKGRHPLRDAEAVRRGL